MLPQRMPPYAGFVGAERTANNVCRRCTNDISAFEGRYPRPVRSFDRAIFRTNTLPPPPPSGVTAQPPNRSKSVVFRSKGGHQNDERARSFYMTDNCWQMPLLHHTVQASVSHHDFSPQSLSATAPLRVFCSTKKISGSQLHSVPTGIEANPCAANLGHRVLFPNTQSGFRAIAL
jgi:hypothetical protein